MDIKHSKNKEFTKVDTNSVDYIYVGADNSNGEFCKFANKDKPNTETQYQTGKDKLNTETQYQTGKDKPNTETQYQTGKDKLNTETQYQTGKDKPNTETQYQTGKDKLHSEYQKTDDADSTKPSGEKKTIRGKVKKKRNLWSIKITFVSLFLCAFISFLSELTASSEYMVITIMLLLFLILTSILFDGIGVAVTSCELSPIMSMAARKIYGAKTAMWLVKNNEKVSNVCSDVIGDIFGIISGACSAVIVAKVIIMLGESWQKWLAIGISSVVAALTIGGKAFMKNLAISNSKEFVMFVARIIAIFSSEERRRKKKQTNQKKKYETTSTVQYDTTKTKSAEISSTVYTPEKNLPVQTIDNRKEKSTDNKTSQQIHTNLELKKKLKGKQKH